MDLRTYFSAIAQQYKTHAQCSRFHFELSPPDASVAGASVTSLELSIHPSLRALWAHTADSNDAPVFHDGETLIGYRLLAFDDALARHTAFQTTCRFEPELFPFAADADGADYALLFVASHTGEVHRFVHDPDRTELIAETLELFLTRSIEAISLDPEEFLQIY